MKRVKTIVWGALLVECFISAIMWSQPQKSWYLQIHVIGAVISMLALALKVSVLKHERSMGIKMLVQCVEGAGIILILSIVSPIQGLALCMLYALESAQSMHRLNAILLTLCISVAYFFTASINAAWQFVLDKQEITYFFAASLIILLPVIIYLTIQMELNNIKSKLSNKNNLLTVKESVVQELEKSREKIRTHAKVIAQEAKIDTLTPLYNRRYITEYIEYIISESQFDEVVVLNFFISNLAIYTNDSEFGASEVVIEELGDIIYRNISEKEVAARYDGCEFIIVVKNMPEEKAEAIAKDIKYEFESEREDHPEKWLLHIEYGLTHIQSRHDTCLEVVARCRLNRKLRGRG